MRVINGLVLLIHKKYGPISVCDAGGEVDHVTDIKLGPELSSQSNTPRDRIVGKV
jgi:hypothetical protein